MTDDGQGLALKGADEVGGAQEDNTIIQRPSAVEVPPPRQP